MPRKGTPKRALESDDDDELTVPRRGKRSRQVSSHHADLLPTDRRQEKEGIDAQYQPGAIRRVKLTNFVTYSSVEFFPGPSLNMVIGPNGTGKSTLVCAICIGLGWDPKFLGRAKDVSEFVKHGADDAYIEIELQKLKDSPQHTIVRCNIRRDGNRAMYSINSRPFSAKQIKARVGKLGVQIDNLCQFLPQDRVVEFAAMTPVELLKSTQRAIASQKMIDDFETLKDLKKDQRKLEHAKGNHDGELANLEAQHKRQEGDVQRIRERQEVKTYIEKLEKLKPLVEYADLVHKMNTAKENMESLSHELESLEESVGPALQQAKEKDAYKKAIEEALRDRKQLVEAKFGRVEHCEDEIKELDTKIQSYEPRDKNLKAEIARIRSEENKTKLEIRGIRARLDKPAPVSQDKIDAAFEKIRRIGREERENSEAHERLEEECNGIRAQIREYEGNIQRQEARLRTLNSQVGRQQDKLYKINQQTARAWQWVQRNQELFKERVFGPPILECTVKDPRDVDLVESLIPLNEMLVLTTQTKEDFILLQKKLREQGLSRVNQRQIGAKLEQYRHPADEQQMSRFGLEDWVVNRINGPPEVLVSLCEGAKIHSTGFASREMTEQQFQAISSSNVQQWVTPGGSFRVSRRREYGPGAVSTNTRIIGKAKYWTDEPIDASLSREIGLAIKELEDDKRTAGIRLKELIANEKRGLETRRADLKVEMSKAREEQTQYQRAMAEHAALPVKLERAQARLESFSGEMLKQLETIGSIQAEHDDAVVAKGEAAIRYADAVDEVRLVMEELQEAEVMLIEARSDSQIFAERNREINHRLEEKRKAKQVASDDYAKAKKAAKELSKKLRNFFQGVEEEDREWLRAKKEEIGTMQELQAEMGAQQARLSLLQGDDGGRTMEMYEQRATRIAALRDRVAEYATALEEITEKVTSLRNGWEPKLDRLVKQISRSFEYNMKQINCAGEVGVYKDEKDFEQWSIQIKVKFRENEPLSQLDSHRQSGGERAVSTIFYLMSLQSLTRSPFRVVDEINQGMDPRNERLVHSRMVSIATGKDDMPVAQIRIPRHRQDEDDGENEDSDDEEARQTGASSAQLDGTDDNDGESGDVTDGNDDTAWSGAENGTDNTGSQTGSQYFLITPKLLPDLRYERGMRVLCIGSGEHMPPVEKQLVDFGRALQIRSELAAAAAG